MKEKLEKLVNQGLKISQVADELNFSKSYVSRLLKKYGLKSIYVRPHKCENCGETNPLLFYPNKKGLCRKCKDAQSLSYKRNKRQKIISFLGGKCEICNFDKYPVSLDIHHLDPSKKDPNFKCINHWEWKRVKKELEGCILVCSNCHRAIHCGYIKI